MLVFPAAVEDLTNPDKTPPRLPLSVGEAAAWLRSVLEGLETPAMSAWAHIVVRPRFCPGARRRAWGMGQGSCWAIISRVPTGTGPWSFILVTSWPVHCAPWYPCFARSTRASSTPT